MYALHTISIVLLAVLTQKPAPPAAASGRAADQIRTLVAARQFDAALAAYDRQVAASSNVPDPALLAIVARAQLNEIAAGADADFAVDAREQLAAAGDQAALAALREKASGPAGSDTAVAATTALLRLGDRATIDRVVSQLQAAPPAGRAALINTLGKTGATAAGPAVAKFLNDQSPDVRAVAARAVGALGVRDAIPALRSLFEKDTPTVKVFAAGALKRLGDRSADAYLADQLASEVPDVRLRAADAYSAADSKIWLAPVRELRTDANDLVRVHVAERLACCDAATSRALLFDALNSPNPLLRGEAARVFDETTLGDAKVARRLMGEPLDALRLRGASIAMRLARPAKKPA